MSTLPSKTSTTICHHWLDYGIIRHQGPQGLGVGLVPCPWCQIEQLRDELADKTHEAVSARLKRANAPKPPAHETPDLLRWRAQRAIGLLEDAPSAAREALTGGYDHEFAPSQKASERRGTPEEEADWAEFGDCPRCWRCAAPIITIPGSAPSCIRNCPQQPSNGLPVGKET